MSWWHYLLLVNFYLILFFGFYALLLRRETFFQLNRIYLIAASLLSFAIPLIQSDWVKGLFITKEVQYTLYNGPAVMGYTITPTPVSALTMGQLFYGVYIAITLFLVLRLLWQLLILKKAIEKPSPSAAYSFFKKISLGENQDKSGIIAKHEQVHAGQWHSVDVMIIETVMIINWFNPVVYLYRFAIKYIHEFIADRHVVQRGTDKADYALLLLNQTFNVPAHALVNSFYNHTLLKKRIMMLYKNNSNRIALAKYGLSAPLFMLMMVFTSATVNNSKAVNAINKKTETVFSTPAEDAFTIITDHAKIPDNIINEPVIGRVAVTDTVPNNNKVYAQTETMPQFPGGTMDFFKFLANNTRYPAIDRENKITGKVFVQFIVEKDGSLTNINAVRGPSATLMSEAVRVLGLSPKWKPGIQNGNPVRVMFTVPINFTLNTSNTLPAAKAPGLSSTVSTDENRIYAQVEVQPEFPGGMREFSGFLAKNIHYPAADKASKTEGKVYIQFVVEKDGSISGTRALRGPSEDMMNEAIRVMSVSPKWKPGIQNNRPVRVMFTVPINFTLQKAGPTGAITDTTKRIRIGKVIENSGLHVNEKGYIDARGFKDTTADKRSPLYVIDGVVRDKKSFDQLDPNAIESFSILKDASATIYGAEANNGVILVTTRNLKKPADKKNIN